VTFWDTSGIVPLVVEQQLSRSARRVLASDADVVAWWGTPVECASAFARLRRDDVLTIAEESTALGLLRTLRYGWREILPSEEVRTGAQRLLRVHPLRAADALQLAAARVWASGGWSPRLVTFDERMARAARLEGFAVLGAED
jgi:predicted nucleic acid-binding protein